MNDPVGGASPVKQKKPDAQAAQDFMQRLGGEPVLCYSFPDNSGFQALRGPDALKQALKYNARGYNIYYTLNRVSDGVIKKPSKSEIEVIQAVCGDIDWDRKKFCGDIVNGFAELAEKADRLMSMECPPTLIVSTGGGLQPIWFIEALPNTPENIIRAEAVGKYIEGQFGGDPVWNIDRVLRLPGTINYPKKSKRDAGQTTALARILYDSGRSYKIEGLHTPHGVLRWGLHRSLTIFSAALISQIHPRQSPVANKFTDGFREFDAWVRSYQKEIDALEAKGAISAEETTRLRTHIQDLIADHPAIVGELAAGIGALELQTLRQVGLAIASIPNGPFSERKGWLDLLFVCAGCADENPHLANRFEDIFHKCSEKAGGKTKDNQNQWNVTVGRTASLIQTATR